MTETNTNSLPGSLNHINTRKTASQVLTAVENGPGMLNIPSLGPNWQWQAASRPS